MQSGLFSPVAETPELVFHQYERIKRLYLNTAQLCKKAGFVFCPLILEAHAGGWSPLTRAKVDWLAKSQAASQNEDPSSVSLRIAQRISCALQRENARALVRRLVADVGGRSDCNSAAWVNEPAEAEDVVASCPFRDIRLAGAEGLQQFADEDL